MWEYYLTKRLPLAKWAIRQHVHGLTIDEEKRQPILKQVWLEEIKPKQDALNEALKEVGYWDLKPLTKTKKDKFDKLGFDYNPDEEGLNVNSSQQLGALLRALGYNISDTSEETLSGIADESITAKTAMEIRSGFSLLTSVSRDTDADNRFRTSLNLHVTETTRLSSTKSHFGTGTNLQNITPKARPLFCGSEENEDAN